MIGSSTRWVEIVNVSMDGKHRTREAQESWTLDPIPMDYGLTRDQARDWGLFLVKTEGTLRAAEISSTPFLQSDLEDLIDRLAFIAEKGYPPRSTA